MPCCLLRCHFHSSSHICWVLVCTIMFPLPNVLPSLFHWENPMCSLSPKILSVQNFQGLQIDLLALLSKCWDYFVYTPSTCSPWFWMYVVYRSSLRPFHSPTTSCQRKLPECQKCYHSSKSLFVFLVPCSECWMLKRAFLTTQGIFCTGKWWQIGVSAVCLENVEEMVKVWDEWVEQLRQRR